jgi:hypothetical protein
MRFRPPEIFLGIFLTVAVFAMGMLFESSRRPPAEQQAASNTAKENQGHPPERTIWNWLTHDAAGFFTLWLVIVGGGQIGLFYWQLRLIKVAADDAKRAGIAAERAAKATEDAVELSRKTAQRQLRAYVGVQSIGFQPTQDAFKIRVKLVIKNFGQTPAFNYQTDIRLTVIDSEFLIALVPHQPIFLEKGGQTLMPGGESIVICESAPNVMHRAGPILNEIRSGKLTVVAAGKIFYIDAFGDDCFTNVYKLASGERAMSDSPFIDPEKGNDST